MAKAKTAPYVAIKTDVRKDDRFEVLGQIAGYNKYEALGRMSHLWAWCRDRKLADAPADSDGYVVADQVVVRFLGEQGVRAILGADVEDLSLGRRHATGLIYLKGTSDDVRALRNAAAAGRARSAGAPRSGGKFTSDSENTAGEPVEGRWSNHQQSTSDSPATPPPTDQRATSDSPATAGLFTSDSPAPPTSDLRPPGSERETRARERHPDVGSIARATWLHASKLCSDLKAANVNAPPWPLQHGPDHTGWVDLLARVGELLVNSTADEASRRALNRVDVAAAKARKDGDGSFFKPTAMFTRKSFDAFVDDDPKNYERKPTAANTRGPTDSIRKVNVL